jgi:hypothetical protein
MKRKHNPNTILKLVIRIFTTVLQVRIEMQGVSCRLRLSARDLCLLRPVSDAAAWKGNWMQVFMSAVTETRLTSSCPLRVF